MSEFSKRLGSLTPEQRRLLELKLQKKGLPASLLPDSSGAGGASRRNAPPAPSEDAPESDGRTPVKGMRFSLFFFSGDGSKAETGKYHLLLESAKFADREGFSAVWTPERHFQDFGGLYPNPSVLGAALAMVTERVQIRAGSVALPLHHPVRVAEEWAVVDNLSGGRVAVSFASGWHAGDFVLAPDAYPERKEVMFSHIELFRRLWAGETVAFAGVNGKEIELKTLPRPVQPQLPFWITSAGNPETWARAGEIGANVLCGMQGETFETLGRKVELYRAARAGAGHDPLTGQVSVMLHTFLGEELGTVKEQTRPALTAYLQTFLKESQNESRKSAGVQVESASDAENEMRAALAFEYYFNRNSLLGTIGKCARMVDGLAAIGVDEIACLIDFGLEVETVLGGLCHLNELRRRYDLAPGTVSSRDPAAQPLAEAVEQPGQAAQAPPEAHASNG
jgi:natural product biosynthesis luciferase-like monooxygenase protein